MIHKAAEVLETLDDIYREVGRQETLRGTEDHPDGTGTPDFKSMAEAYLSLVRSRRDNGDPITWADLLLEEVYEALAADNPAELIERLIYASGVSVSWIRSINDR